MGICESCVKKHEVDDGRKSLLQEAERERNEAQAYAYQYLPEASAAEQRRAMKATPAPHNRLDAAQARVKNAHKRSQSGDLSTLKSQVSHASSSNSGMVLSKSSASLATHENNRGPKPKTHDRAATEFSGAQALRIVEPSHVALSLAGQKTDEQQIERRFGADCKWKGNLEEEFQVIGKLGEGAFGAVYSMRHKELLVDVAVKMIPITENNEEVEKKIKDIEDEVRVLKRAGTNPHVVAYYGMWGPDSQGRLWVLMELCAAGSLADMITRSRVQVTERQLCYILRCLLEGLDALHKAKIVHRDIKADNIFVSTDGTVKLGDFGVAKDLRQNTEETIQSNGIVGSPLWMAPEMTTGENISYKVDIWALGITAIEIAEGVPPRHEINVMRVLRMVANSAAPTLNKNVPFWSSRFRDFVQQCLTKDPKNRPMAAQLLQHPFITAAKSTGPHVLAPVVKRFFRVCRTANRDSKKARKSMFVSSLDRMQTIHKSTQRDRGTSESRIPDPAAVAAMATESAQALTEPPQMDSDEDDDVVVRAGGSSDSDEDGGLLMWGDQNDEDADDGLSAALNDLGDDDAILK